MSNNEINNRVAQLRICLAKIDESHGTKIYNNDMGDEEILDLVKSNFGDYASHVEYFTERKIEVQGNKDTVLSHILRFTSTSEFLLTYLLTTNRGKKENTLFREFLAKDLHVSLIEEMEKFNYLVPNFDNPNAFPFAHLQVCRHLGYYGNNFDITYAIEAAKFFNIPLPEYAKTEQEQQIVAKAMTEYNPITYSNLDAKTLDNRVVKLLNTLSRVDSDFTNIWAQHQHDNLTLKSLRHASQIFAFVEKHSDYYKYFTLAHDTPASEHMTKIKNEWQLINNEYKKMAIEISSLFRNHYTKLANENDAEHTLHTSIGTSFDDEYFLKIIAQADSLFTPDRTNDYNKFLSSDAFPFGNFAAQYHEMQNTDKNETTKYQPILATQVIGLNTAMNFAAGFIENIEQINAKKHRTSITTNLVQTLAFGNIELYNLVQNTLWKNLPSEKVKSAYTTSIKYHNALSNSVNFAVVDQKLLHGKKTQAKQDLAIKKKLVMDAFTALASSLVPESIVTTTSIFASLYLMNKEARKQKMIKDSGLAAKTRQICAFLSNVIALRVNQYRLNAKEESVLVNYLSVVMSTMLTSTRTLKVIKYLSEAEYQIKDKKNDPIVKDMQYVLRFCDLFLNVAKSPIVINELKLHLRTISIEIPDDRGLLQLLEGCTLDPKLLLDVIHNNSSSKDNTKLVVFSQKTAAVRPQINKTLRKKLFNFGSFA